MKTFLVLILFVSIKIMMVHSLPLIQELLHLLLDDAEYPDESFSPQQYPNYPANYNNNNYYPGVLIKKYLKV